MIKCIKSIVKLTANLISVIGIIILVFGCYVLYNQVGLNYSNLYYNTADWLKTLQEYGFIIIGFLIFLIGCAGMYSAKKKKPACKKTCLLIYQIGALTFFALCSGLAIFTLVYSNDIFDKNCTATPYFETIDTQLKQAELLFCSSNCQCYATSDTVSANPTGFQGKNYTSDENTPNKVEQIQKCDAFVEEDYAAAAQLMQTAEILLHCTGWCTPTPFYVFSDINEGTPDGQCCYAETKEFVENNGKILGWILFGLAVLFGFNVLFVFCLCCMKDQKKRKQGVYIAM